MTQQADPTGGTPTSESERELSDAELDGITAGVGGLVHETVHSGTVSKPTPAPTPSSTSTSTRSPPTFGA